MNNPELLTFYEKMYDSENEIKERINTRVQIIFTLLIAVATVASYMLRMLDLNAFPELTGVIVFLMLLFFVSLGLSAYFSVRAFWGNEFKKMPGAFAVNDYYTDLVNYNSDLSEYLLHNKGYEAELVDIDVEMDGFFQDYYMECAEHNSNVNFRRSRQVHLSIKFLLYSMAPFALAGLLFVAFDMDASSPRKDLLIMDRHVGAQLQNIHEVLAELVKIQKQDEDQLYVE